MPAGWGAHGLSEGKFEKPKGNTELYGPPVAGPASALQPWFTHMVVVSEAAPLMGLLRAKTEETAGQC